MKDSRNLWSLSLGYWLEMLLNRYLALAQLLCKKNHLVFLTHYCLFLWQIRQSRRQDCLQGLLPLPLFHCRGRTHNRRRTSCTLPVEHDQHRRHPDLENNRQVWLCASQEGVGARSKLGRYAAVDMLLILYIWLITVFWICNKLYFEQGKHVRLWAGRSLTFLLAWTIVWLICFNREQFKIISGEVNYFNCHDLYSVSKGNSVITLLLVDIYSILESESPVSLSVPSFHANSFLLSSSGALQSVWKEWKG